MFVFVAADEEEAEAVPEGEEDADCELPMLRYSEECFADVGMKSSKMFARLEILKILKILIIW